MPMTSTALDWIQEAPSEDLLTLRFRLGDVRSRMVVDQK